MPTFEFEYITAGRNAGFKPWRDHDDPEFVYQLRETNETDDDPLGFQLVKINVVTGAIVDSGPVYLASSNYDAFGACYVTPTAIHTAGVNLASVSGSSKVYLFGSSGFGSGPYDHVVIEFDKTTLDVTDSWAVGPVGSDTRSRDRGVAVMNLAGTLLANGGNSNLTASTFTASYIDIFRPSDGAYNRVDLNADLGITGYHGLYFFYDAPICFDHAGNLWFITAPWANGTSGRPDRSTGASTLYKCSIDGSLNLTILDSFAIPDNYYAYTAGAGLPLSFSESFGYKRMVCNPTDEKLYLWSAWREEIGGDDEEGWFLEFDLNSETFTRGPIAWTGGEEGDLEQKLDSIGFTYEDYFVTWRRNGSLAAAAFIIFQISTATERAIVVNTDFALSKDLHEATFFHSFIGGSDFIYAMDVDYDSVDGWQIYRDALFSILNDDCPPDEECLPCEADTEPCGETVEQACNAVWPFALLQPRSVGIHMVPGNIGGGPAMAGGNEDVAPTAYGFWRFTYADIPVHDRDQILAMRAMEVLLEGRAGVICLHAYEGKRAPWLTVGGAIVASADGAIAAGATAGNIKMTTGGVPRAGMFFSWEETTSGSIAGPHLYCLKTVGAPAGSPPVYPVTFEPPIRTTIADDDALEFARPVCRARLADDRGMSMELNLLEHASQTIEFEEDVP